MLLKPGTFQNHYKSRKARKIITQASENSEEFQMALESEFSQ